jgi:hypothetical protein
MAPAFCANFVNVAGLLMFLYFAGVRPEFGGKNKIAVNNFFCIWLFNFVVYFCVRKAG